MNTARLSGRTTLVHYGEAEGRKISAEEKDIIRQGMLNPGEYLRFRENGKNSGINTNVRFWP